MIEPSLKQEQQPLTRLWVGCYLAYMITDPAPRSSKKVILPRVLQQPDTIVLQKIVAFIVDY